MRELYELDDGQLVPVVIKWQRHHYSARVVRVDDGPEDEVDGTWALTWTDGINVWYEEYELPWQAIARLAALVAAAEQEVFLVHDPSNRGAAEGAAFVEEAERFVARTVHAFNCPAGCDGSSATHRV